MTIRWFGHSCFSIVTDAGTTVLTDPFDSSVGYALPDVAADIVTVSHQHHDHNDTSYLRRADTVLSQPGKWEIQGVSIRATSAFHDSVRGAKRGSNLLFCISADGLTIAHMGDLGHALDEEQLAAVRGADILLLPVGGYYTIDASQAEDVRQAVGARLTIPMHFKTPAIHFPISDEKPFLARNGGQYAHKNELRVDRESIAQLPEVLVLEYE